MSESLNLPAEIDRIGQQLDQARDIETVREIRDRAEALRVYCRKHDGLMEAGNRLAGITALCERRIGMELRRMPSAQGRRSDLVGDDHEVLPTLEELGFKDRHQAADYKELAHPDVTEQVLLDAIAAGAEGREVTKKDIRKAVREELGKAPPPDPEPCDPELRDPELRADLEAASMAWVEGEADRDLWWPVVKAPAEKRRGEA